MSGEPARLPRYPGAHPFTDHPVSRKIFFGREEESRRLVDQILSSRLTVLYARSGSGKTSLLNASVAPALREQGYAPLIARVNDLVAGPIRSVMDGVLAHAGNQGLEIANPSGGTLPSMLEQTEFWLNDVLLRPVLIVDQFEELFTLHPPHRQDEFLAQLAEVVRGRPASAAVVLSLREDYVTYLEDAAGHLPGILDHRFRLTALRYENAMEAFTRPAQVQDERLANPPFRFDPRAARVVLTYLETLATNERDARAGRIEPFFLQLVGSYLEEKASGRFKRSGVEILLGEKDVGGADELAAHLLNFLKTSIRHVGTRKQRRAIRSLMVNQLINQDGRRVSASEPEILEQSGLDPAILNQLVAARILRMETRANTNYYELPHDALVQPVLDLRRWRMRLSSVLGMVFFVGFFIFMLLNTGATLWAIGMVASEDPDVDAVIEYMASASPMAIPLELAAMYLAVRYFRRNRKLFRKLKFRPPAIERSHGT